MPLFSPRQAFRPSCPSGGHWYACASGTSFVGCCESEPCTNSCPDGNLRPASYNKNSYGTFPDQQCPNGSRWYTCTGVSPPFMGCCKSNPCSKGCPVGDLAAGFLSSNPNVAAPFLPSSASSSTRSPSASSSSIKASSTSTSTSPISSTTSSPATSTPAPTTSPGVIAGAAVGGVAVAAVLIGLLLFYCHRHAKSSRERHSFSTPATHGPSTGAGIDRDPQDAKNLYSSASPDSQTTPLPAYKDSVSPKEQWETAPHSPQPTYELPSPDISPPTRHRQTTYSPYSNGLNINFTTPYSPSATSHMTWQSRLSAPLSQSALSELSSAEDTARHNFRGSG